MHIAGRYSALFLALILCLTALALPALAQEDSSGPRMTMGFDDPEAPGREPEQTGIIEGFADGTLEISAMTMMRRPAPGEEGAPEDTAPEGTVLEGTVPEGTVPEGTPPEEGAVVIQGGDPAEGEAPQDPQERGMIFKGRDGTDADGEMPQGEKMSLKLAQGVRLRQIAMVDSEIAALDIFSDALEVGKLARIWLNADGEIEYLQMVNLGDGMRFRQGS